MGSSGVHIIPLLLLVFLMAAAPTASTLCQLTRANFAPCVLYAQGPGGTPPDACCNGLRALSATLGTSGTGLRALCRCLMAEATLIPSNPSTVASLPGKCTPKVALGFTISATTNCAFGYLYPQFYDYSCPQAKEIVQYVVAKAVAKEARMGASLLRLHFHDCFVMGCDASILLDSSGSIISEKGSNPNRNSARGFDVIDEIKASLEKACPGIVSCADILALAARDSTVLLGGPSWDVLLGRRDSTGASLTGSNNNIPAPNNTLPTIIAKFKRQGLDDVDVVALSGGHTIGMSRCTSFRQRLYNQSGNGLPDNTLDPYYAAQLRSRCPRSGGDQILFPLDFVSPTKFDNYYFKNIQDSKGLLSSDQVLFTKNATTMALVKQYAENNALFFQQFAKSMVKMGNITPLIGIEGEIRKNCRRVNTN